MKSIFIIFLLTISFNTLAAFDGKAVPKHVRVLPCDSNPRIVVIFEDSSKNIWYPLNGSEGSQSFLSIALTAYASKTPMYFLGTGNADDLTSYCISSSARRVDAFGLN